MITRKHLRNAFHDGEFILPYRWTFWAQIVGDDQTCWGESKEIGAEVICTPMRLSQSGSALLLNLRDTNGKDWFAWFHADQSFPKLKTQHA